MSQQKENEGDSKNNGKTAKTNEPDTSGAVVEEKIIKVTGDVQIR